MTGRNAAIARVDPDGHEGPLTSSATGLSVILCCHNSSGRLEPTLAHLAAQTGIGGYDCEIVLVDNASTDQTASHARNLWQAFGAPCDLRIVAEPKLGLIHARIAGISAARYEILTFVDDDNWISPNWCETIFHLMTDHPELGVIGCRSEAVFEAGQIVPPWFGSLQHGYAVGPQGLSSGWVQSPLPRFYGAGLTVRHRALKTLFCSGFSALMSGRSGDRLLSGEDSELCYALALMGWRFWYEDRLRLKHFVPASRLTDRYAQQLFYGLGYTSSVEDYYLERVPNRGSLGLKTFVRRTASARYLNTIRNLLAHEARANLLPSGSDANRQAIIEANFFRGRLKGIRDRQASGKEISDQIARWADRARIAGQAAGYSAAPKHERDRSCKTF